MTSLIKIAVGLLVVVLFGVCGRWCLVTTYWSGTHISSITTFASNKELFVFAGRRTSVIKESRLHRLLRVAVFSFPIAESLREDILVFHYSDGRLSNSVIAGVVGGNAYSFHGDVYWARGQMPNESSPRQWRWDGRTFVGLTDAEDSELDRQFTKEFEYSSESSIKEGWKRSSFARRGTNEEATFQLQSEELKLAKVETITGPTIISLSSLGSTQVLVDFSNEEEIISANDYRRLKEEQSEILRKYSEHR